MNLSLFKYAPVLLLLLFFSCKRNSSGKFDEGELVYDIKYLDNSKANPIIELLPKTVKIRFKNDNTVIYVEGFFSTFQLKFITNRQQKKSYTVLRILDKKFYVEMPIDSLSAGYGNFKEMKVKLLPSDTLTMAGLLCHKAIIDCNSLSDSTFYVYYTNDINIYQPNSNSPYAEIPGVLTYFKTQMAGLNMLFRLKEFKSVEVDDKEFVVDKKNYKRISKKDFNELIKSFMH